MKNLTRPDFLDSAIGIGPPCLSVCSLEISANKLVTELVGAQDVIVFLVCGQSFIAKNHLNKIHVT